VKFRQNEKNKIKFIDSFHFLAIFFSNLHKNPKKIHFFPNCFVPTPHAKTHPKKKQNKN
jgi:hypothetical protein